MVSLWYLLGLTFASPFASSSDYVVDIDAAKSVADLLHFWESTGLCPPLPHSKAGSFLLSRDMTQNLLLISSVPHKGVKQVRIHWLLELITKHGSDFDFTDLDRFLDILFKIGLKPGFELMGNPSAYFSNFDDMKQVLEFQELVRLLAKRYISMFGMDYVSTWNFESWNEPDHLDFDNLTVTVNGFLKYYDACSEGLKQVSSSLIFGGPAGSCRQPSFSKRCWALFEHVTNGTNHITGQHGSTLDFISFHKKGSGTAEVILENELQVISQIHSQYPSLTSTPIFNDEADPLVGWSKPQLWRADVTYAALIAKVITQHQNELIANTSRANITYALLSNDNGFLNYAPHYFTQRTLNSRFQVNNTNPKYVHFVRKPALAVMGLLAKLGDVQVGRLTVNDRIGGLASICTSCSNLEISAMLYNSDNSQPTTGSSSIRLRYSNLNATDFLLSKSLLDMKSVVCNLNNFETNPHSIWEKLGKPNYPTPSQFALMHESEEASCSNPASVVIDQSGHVIAEFNLYLPGVALHHLCVKPNAVPGKPTNFRSFNITTGQILLAWDDTFVGTKCIQTYVVEFSTKSQPYSFTTVNRYKITFNSFIFIQTFAIRGYFRVHAVDYWDREGMYSDILIVL